MSRHPDQPSEIAQEDALALIEKKRAEYEASEEFQELRKRSATEISLLTLIKISRMSRRGACVGAAVFINEYGAGLPEVDYYAKEDIRLKAKYWTDCANQNELEAYTVAAVGALADSPLLDKQLRKLAALAYGRMSPETKQKFKDWIDQQ